MKKNLLVLAVSFVLTVFPAATGQCTNGVMVGNGFTITIASLAEGVIIITLETEEFDNAKIVEEAAAQAMLILKNILPTEKYSRTRWSSSRIQRVNRNVQKFSIRTVIQLFGKRNGTAI